MFWKEKFTPINMTSFGRRNVRKHREINNDKQYIVLGVSFDIYCLENREFNYSELRDYMGRPGKGLTNSLTFSTEILDKKKNARTSITDITNQDFRKLL